MTKLLLSNFTIMDSNEIEEVKAIIEKKTGEKCSWERAEKCTDLLNLIAEMIA